MDQTLWEETSANNTKCFKSNLLVFTCSKLTIETLKKGAKYVQS